MSPLWQILAGAAVLVALILFARHVFLALMALWTGEAERREEARERREALSREADTGV